MKPSCFYFTLSYILLSKWRLSKYDLVLPLFKIDFGFISIEYCWTYFFLLMFLFVCSYKQVPMYLFCLCISVCFSFFLVRTLSFCLYVHTNKFLCIYFVYDCLSVCLFLFLLRPNTQFLFVCSYKQVPMYLFCLSLSVCLFLFPSSSEQLSVTYLNSLPSMTIIKFFLSLILNCEEFSLNPKKDRAWVKRSNLRRSKLLLCKIDQEIEIIAKFLSFLQSWSGDQGVIIISGCFL